MSAKTTDERVEQAALQIHETAGRWPTPAEVAEALTDEDVSRGDYEGCSPELDGWASDYMAAAERAGL